MLKVVLHYQIVKGNLKKHWFFLKKSTIQA